jgi:iron complex outermembrane receptor protein
MRRQFSRELIRASALAAALASCLGASVAGAQGGAGRLTVRVVQDTVPIAGARVRTDSISAVTNDSGVAIIRVPAGAAHVVVTNIGFRPESLTVQIRAGFDSTVVVHLVPQAAQVAPVFVTTTRTLRRLDQEPLRIEVLGGDDVGEKSEMRPADSRTLLSEMSGVRVQTRSPLGATNIRIQGLPGRYTAVLNDGLPIFGGQASSFTLVDVVPLDLRQAEVIKGAASALYGPQALGGVVNLISRRPPDTSQVLVNQSDPSSTDAMAFVSQSFRPSVGLTVLAGVHQQQETDRDHDGWADAAGFRRVELRPRLFFSDSSGHSLMVTAGGFAERRSAGSFGLAASPAAGPRAPFYDSVSTGHGDAGVIGQWRVSSTLSLAARASFTNETRAHRFGDSTEHADRRTVFGEVSAAEIVGSNTLVAGVAALRDVLSMREVARLNSVRATPGVFVQDTYSPRPWLAGTANARCDRSNAFGTICTPRLSLLARAGPAVSARLSVGNGWFAPSVVTDETETFALRAVHVPQPLAAERGRSASFDLTATRGPLQLNGTLFSNRVGNPVGLRRIAGDTTGAVDVINAAGALEIHGGEAFAVFNQEPFVATAYYSATRTREISTETGRPRELPLTPREAAGIDFALEDDESGAYAAIEIFYTGRQALEDNPYAAVSSPYTTLGILLADQWRAFTVFLNGENLTNVRQTAFQPLVRTAPGEGGRWTVDPWAPLEGRRLNLGVRWHW